MSTAKPTRPEDHLLIRSITPDGQSAVEVGGISVFVGPNNVGKTAALRDLVLLAGNYDVTSKEGQPEGDVVTTVIRDVTFVGKITLDRLLRGLDSMPGETSDATIVQGIGPDLRTPFRASFGAEIKNVLYRPVMTARSVRTTALGQVMPLRAAYLDAERMGELLHSAPACSPLQAPESLLQALHYAAPSVHAELDAAFRTAFPDRHVRLDASEHVNLHLRVAAEFPPPIGDPVKDALQLAQLSPADREGVGLQTYLSVVLTMLLCQGRLILLDQPETALYPEQARRLGRWIGQNSPRLGCQVFIATQSPALLQGLLEGSADISVFQLSRTGNLTRWQAVPADVAGALARFPIFSAQQAIELLFSDGAVLIPGADARLVYETAAQRFVGSGNLRFLQTYGARNLAVLARTLRKAELPIAVVAELDVLQSEAGFSELVKAVTGNPPPAPWLATRERLAKHVDGMLGSRQLAAAAHEVESFLDQMKKGDAEAAQVAASDREDPREKWARLQRDQMASVPPDLRVWVEELLDELKHAGLFLSPRGGFEGWLIGGQATADPEINLARAVQALSRGECPAELRAFLNEIVSYLRLQLAPTRPARLNVRS
jgi:hypothetical protein